MKISYATRIILCVGDSSETQVSWRTKCYIDTEAISCELLKVQVLCIKIPWLRKQIYKFAKSWSRKPRSHDWNFEILLELGRAILERRHFPHKTQMA